MLYYLKLHIEDLNNMITPFSSPVSYSSNHHKLAPLIASSQSSSYQPENEKLQSIINEMNQRSTNLAYGLGVGLGKLLGTRTDEDGVKTESEVAYKHIKTSNNVTEPFSNYFDQLFPQDIIRVLYIELDPGVDDGAALLQLLAENSSNQEQQKKIEIVGIVPCVGNAVLTQTEQNTMQFLELTGNQQINVYPGAIAPLAIENNQTAIEEMEKAINEIHFYGQDGESDVGGWPKVTMNMQETAGYLFAANLIMNASPDAPLTLVSTSSLTELSKTLSELEKMEAQKGLTLGSFAKHINAISIMGGCLDPKVGCNAPFNVPDHLKNSEANFYFDAPAAQQVFAICQKYGIPILLAPLDLTQEPGLLWTKE